MTHAEFETVLEKIITEIRARLSIKSSEYASVEDKMHNFRRAAKIDRISPIEALRGMELKHITSIRDLLDRYAAGEEIGLDLWWEKIIDEINYLILLYGLLSEET